MVASHASPSPAPGAVIRELILTRLFDAPRERVFKAWTEAEHLAQWFGPQQFTNPVCEVDARPGGALRIDMRGPDGAIYPNIGLFHEVVEPERLVLTLAALNDKGETLIEALYTVTFADRGGKTELKVVGQVTKVAPDAAAHLAGMEEGWNQTLDRLRTMATNAADREVIFTRMFDAPRELVFDVWTDPRHLAHWWGPNGFTITTSESDVRPGGVWRFVMHGPDGVDYKNHVVYLEVVRPQRLVYEHVPEKGTDFVSFETTVRFGDVGGKTVLTMRALFPSAAALKHVAEKYNAIEGGKQTLGRLGAYLEQL